MKKFILVLTLMGCFSMVRSYAGEDNKRLADCGIIMNQGGESLIVASKDLDTTSKKPEEITITAKLKNGTLVRAVLEWNNMENVYELLVDVQRPKADGKMVLASRAFNFSTVLPLDYHTMILDFENNGKELNPSLDDILEQDPEGFTINVSCYEKN